MELFSSMEVDFFLPQTPEFNKNNMFSLVFVTLEFRFAGYSLQLTQWASIATYNQAIFFLTIYFSAFDFITLSDLNSDLNHLIEFFFITVFWVDCLICLNISLIVLKMSKSSLLKLILINLQLSSCSITFCFFYFIVNTSVTASIFINFYCDFIVMKIQVNSII